MVYIVRLFVGWKRRRINTEVDEVFHSFFFVRSCFHSETFVIRDKELLRSQEHIVAFTDISRSRPMKSMANLNNPTTKYLVIYIIRIGTMYVNENAKDYPDGNLNTLKKTKNEANDLRRPYMVACECRLVNRN